MAFSTVLRPAGTKPAVSVATPSAPTQEPKVRVPEELDLVKLAETRDRLIERRKAEGKSEVEAIAEANKVYPEAATIIGRYGSPGETAGFARVGLEAAGEAAQRGAKAVFGEETPVADVIGAFTEPNVVSEKEKPGSIMGFLKAPRPEATNVLGKTLQAPTEAVPTRIPEGATAAQIAKAVLPSRTPTVPEPESVVQQRVAMLDKAMADVDAWEQAEKAKIVAKAQAGTINPFVRTARWAKVEEEAKGRRAEVSKDVAESSPSILRDLGKGSIEGYKAAAVLTPLGFAKKGLEIVSSEEAKSAKTPSEVAGVLFRGFTEKPATEFAGHAKESVRALAKVPESAVGEGKAFGTDVATQLAEMHPAGQKSEAASTSFLPPQIAARKDVAVAAGGALLNRLGAAMTEGEVITEGPDKGKMKATTTSEILRVLGTAASGLPQASATRAVERSGIGTTTGAPTTTSTPLQALASKLPGAVGETFKVQQKYKEGESTGQSVQRAVNFATGLADPTQLFQGDYWRDYARQVSDNLGFFDVGSQVVSGLELDPRSPAAMGIRGLSLVADVAGPWEEMLGSAAMAGARLPMRAYKGARTVADLGGTVGDIARGAATAAVAEPLRAFGTPLPSTGKWGDVQAAMLDVEEEAIAKRAARTGTVQLPTRTEDRLRQTLAAAVPGAKFEDFQDDFIARLSTEVPVSEKAQAFVGELKAAGVKLNTPDDERAAGILADAMATGWSKMAEGRTPDQFFDQRIAGVTTEVPGVEALRQGDIDAQGLAPIFYSPLVKQVDHAFGLRNDKPMKAESLLAAVKKNVKQEELDWTGFEDWLAEKKGGLVTKEEAAEWARNQQVRLGEVQKGDELVKAQEAVADAKIQKAWDDYDAGLEVIRHDPNRTSLERELAAKRDVVVDAANAELHKQGGTTGPRWETYRVPGPASNYRELVATLPQDLTKETYTSLHWEGIENPMFHVRMTDRVDAAGNKVLFIDEVQSDWLQALKKEKPQPSPDEIKAYEKISDEFEAAKFSKEPGAYAKAADVNDAALTELAKKYGFGTDNDGLNEVSSWMISYIEGREKRIPQAPWMNTWHELAVKRILRYAAENGYDRVAFTPGEAIWKVVSGSDENKAGLLNFYDRVIPDTLKKMGKKWGAVPERIVMEGDARYAQTPEKLARYDELRERVDRDVYSLSEAENKELDDLSAMFMEDEASDKAGPGTAVSLPITPKMKDSVLHEGQALFQGGPAPQVGSPAFKAWFGESKVVDVEGKPLTVYHGTQRDFEAFEEAPEAYGTWYVKGHYFTDKPEVASHYATRGASDAAIKRWMKDPESVYHDLSGAQVLPVYLKIENPYIWPESRTAPSVRATNLFHPEELPKDLHAEVMRKLGVNDVKELTNKHYEEGMFLSEAARASQRDIVGAIQDVLKERGYDGVVVEHLADKKTIGTKGIAHKEYIAFSPSQIKSTFNRGTFDPNDPRILFQKRPSTATSEQVLKDLRKKGYIDDDMLLGIIGQDRPKYLDEVVVPYMAEMRKRVMDGKLTNRDTAKALVLSVASQGAGELPVSTIQRNIERIVVMESPTGEKGIFRTYLTDGEKVSEAEKAISDGWKTIKPVDTFDWRNAVHGNKVRPEDAMAAWLFSPKGQQALDAMDKGIVDADAWLEGAAVRYAYGDDRIVNQGLLNPHPTTVRGKVTNQGLAGIPDLTKKVNELRGRLGNFGPEVDAAMSRALGDEVIKLRGIAFAKQGFIKHLLGFGDAPTVDIRALQAYLAGTLTPTAKQGERINKVLTRLDTKGVAGQVIGDITSRVQRLVAEGKVDMEGVPDWAVQHIFHHWLWDKIANAETSHAVLGDAIMNAQQGIRAGSAPRAAVTFLDDGRALIHALEQPDLSSVAHELFHIIEHDMPADMRKDLVDWAKQEGHAVGIDRAGNMTGDPDAIREAKELGARGFETYLATGDAPTPRLARVFEAMKRWLASVYQSIVGSELDIKIPDKMKAVYDRVLGVDTDSLVRQSDVRLSRTSGRKQEPKMFWGKQYTDKEGEVRTSSVYGKVRRYEANRVSISDPDMARELGIRIGEKVEPGELYAAALRKTLANENRRMFPVELTKVTPRSVIPANRLDAVNARTQRLIESVFGDPSSYRVTKGELNGEPILFIPFDEDGRILRRAVDLVHSYGLDADIPERLARPTANFTYATPDEFYTILQSFTDIVAGAGTKRNRVVETMPTAFIDSVVDGLFGKGTADIGTDIASPLTPKREPAPPKNALARLVRKGPAPMGPQKPGLFGRFIDPSQSGAAQQIAATPLHAVETIFERTDFFKRLDPRLADGIQGWQRMIGRVPTQVLRKMKELKRQLDLEDHPIRSRIPIARGAPRATLLSDYFETIAPPVDVELKVANPKWTRDEGNAKVFPAFMGMPEVDVDAIVSARTGQVTGGLAAAVEEKQVQLVSGLYQQTMDPAARAQFLDQAERMILDNEPSEYELSAISRLRAGIGNDNDATYLVRGLLERRQGVVNRGEQILRSFSGKSSEGFGNWRTSDFMEAYWRFYSGDFTGIENMIVTHQGSPVPRRVALSELIMVTETDKVVTEFAGWMRQQQLWMDSESLWKDMLEGKATKPNTRRREARFEDHLRELGYDDKDFNDVFKAHQSKVKGARVAATTRDYRSLVREADIQEGYIKEFQADALRSAGKADESLPDLEAIAAMDPTVALNKRIENIGERLNKAKADMVAARGTGPLPDPNAVLQAEIDSVAKRLQEHKDAIAKTREKHPYAAPHPDEEKLERRLKALTTDKGTRDRWFAAWNNNPASKVAADGDVSAYAKAYARARVAEGELKAIADPKAQAEFKARWKATADKRVEHVKARIARNRAIAASNYKATEAWAARWKTKNPGAGEPAAVVLHRMSHDIAKQFKTRAEADAAIAAYKAELQKAGVSEIIGNGPPPSVADLDKFEKKVILYIQRHISGQLGYAGEIDLEGKFNWSPDAIIDREAYVEAMRQCDRWGIKPSTKDTELPQMFRAPSGKTTWAPTAVRKGVEETLKEAAPVGSQFASKTRFEEFMQDKVGINLSPLRSLGYAWSFAKAGMTMGVWFLPHAAFVGSQAIGSAFQTHLAMGGPGAFRVLGRAVANPLFLSEVVRQVTKEAPQVLSDRYIVAKNGAILTPDMVANLALRGGLDTSQVRSDFFKIIGDDILREISVLPWARDLAAGGELRRVMNEVSTGTDTIYRCAILVDQLREGKSVEEAVAIAQKAILDYANLSDTEKSKFRNFFLFYAYRRRNFALVWDTFKKNPGRLSRVIRLTNDMAKASYDDEWEMLSQDFTGGRMSVPVFTKQNGKWQMDAMRKIGMANYMGVKWYAPPVSHMDAIALLGNFISLPNADAFQELVLSANPFLNLTYGIITEKNLQTMQDIYDPKSYVVPQWVLAWDEAFASGAMRQHFNVTRTTNMAINMPGYEADQAFYIVGEDAKGGDDLRRQWLTFKLVLAYDRTMREYAKLDRANIAALDPMTVANAVMATQEAMFGPRPMRERDEYYLLAKGEGETPRKGVGQLGELAGFGGVSPYFIPTPESVISNINATVNTELNAAEKERRKLNQPPP